ncbi:hypothetical protein SAMN06272765_3294 [Streptomyces sp. Ag109_G2-15]|nr:hypothetical protein SAMN06272765_3294 [Streptomyces sp. Ag109_G2-15]
MPQALRWRQDAQVSSIALPRRPASLFRLETLPDGAFPFVPMQAQNAPRRSLPRGVSGASCLVRPGAPGRIRTCDTRFRSSIQASCDCGRRLVPRSSRTAGVRLRSVSLMSPLDVRSLLIRSSTGIGKRRSYRLIVRAAMGRSLLGAQYFAALQHGPIVSWGSWSRGAGKRAAFTGVAYTPRAVQLNLASWWRALSSGTLLWGREGLDMYNALSLVISLVALGLSGFATLWQLRQARSTSHMTMLLDVALHNIRDRDFQRDQHYVLTRLAQEHEPVVGMDALPEPVRTMTRNVAFSYEYIGAMVALGLVDSDLALSVLHFRVRQVWTALEPYARTEREIRNAPFLPFFENLYLVSFANPTADFLRSLNLRTSGGNSPSQ